MALSLVTPATPGATITVDEARIACRIYADETSFDDLLNMLLPAAVREIEAYIGQSLAPQGWRLTVDEFSAGSCGGGIELPVGPVTAVTAVGYYDADGLPATVDGGDYALDLVSRPQWVVLNEDASWPETLSAVNAVWVDFTAGYTAETLPAEVKGAVLGIVQHRFDNGISAGVPKDMLASVHGLRRILI